MNFVDRLCDAARFFTDQMVGVDLLDPAQLALHMLDFFFPEKLRQNNEPIALVGFQLRRGKFHEGSPDLLA
ncbi:hypothetical protein AWB75_07183 [Caballeronia catudaia]|uniref:Uncharacterized protein n=1 Tax=Caballeronia catudaia TaxID=1777136 RepID=A0A158DUK7_9BURK|nr:hypothetical protein AWB75_07183 [Caballeronia catudaia]